MVLYPALHEGLGIETYPVELHCANTRLTRDCGSTRQIQAAQDRLDHFCSAYRHCSDLLFSRVVLYSALVWPVIFNCDSGLWIRSCFCSGVSVAISLISLVIATD